MKPSILASHQDLRRLSREREALPGSSGENLFKSNEPQLAFASGLEGEATFCGTLETV